MTILADTNIRAAMADGSLVVRPLAPDAVQPSSIDLRLGGALIARALGLEANGASR